MLISVFKYSIPNYKYQDNLSLKIRIRRTEMIVNLKKAIYYPLSKYLMK